MRVQGVPPGGRPRRLRAPAGHEHRVRRGADLPRPAARATRHRGRAHPVGRPPWLPDAARARASPLRVAWDLFRIPLLHRGVRPGAATRATGPRPDGDGSGTSHGARAGASPAAAGVRDRRVRRSGSARRSRSPATRWATTSGRTTRRPSGSSRASRVRPGVRVAGPFGLFFYPPTFIPLVLPFALLPGAGRGLGMDRADGRRARCRAPGDAGSGGRGGGCCSSRACRGRSSTTSSWARWDRSCCSRSRSRGAGSIDRGCSASRRAGRRDQGAARAPARVGAAAPPVDARCGRWSLTLLVLAAVALPFTGSDAWPDFVAIVTRVSDPIASPQNATPGAIAWQLGASRDVAARAPGRDRDRRRWPSFVVAALLLPAEASFMVAVIATQLAVADPVGPLRDRAAAADRVAARARPPLGDAIPLVATPVLLVGLLPASSIRSCSACARRRLVWVAGAISARRRRQSLDAVA